MTNPIANHPTTRAAVIDRLKGLRRLARKLRDKLQQGGAINDARRYTMYADAEQLVAISEATIRLLDNAKPIRRGEEDGNREAKGTIHRPVRRQHQA